MGIYSTKTAWQKALQPIVAFCIRQHVHPDWFTAGALALSLIAALALWQSGTHLAWLWVVPPCVLTRLLLNLMDGQVARALNLADAWGEVKNEFGDRVADAAIFLGLGFSGYVDWRGLALALALILCISYLGILGKAVGGRRVFGGIFGKGDRMISFALFTFIPLLSRDPTSYNLYLALAVLAACITLFQRLSLIHRQVTTE